MEVREGGVGIWRAAGSALAACTASLAAAVPLAADADEAFVRAGVFPPGALRAAVRGRFDKALQHLCDRAPAAVGEQLREAGESGLAHLTERWACARAGEPLPRAADSEDHPRGELFFGDAGLADPEHPAAFSGPSLQRRLMAIQDRGAADRALEDAASAGRWDDHLRLSEVAHPGCDHGWLWALCAAHGPCLDSDEFALAVRVRLGADLTEMPVVCARCQRTVMCGPCLHALNCGGAGETEGHNRVRDSLHAVASAGDPGACLEPTGLLPARPARRPADLLTHAAGWSGGCAALDVGVASPWATGAGADACASMVRRKLRQSAPWAAEAREAGLDYVPVVFSALGRPHEEANAVMGRLARRAARRHGLGSPAVTLRRLRCRVGVEVVRRAVAVSRSCLPGGCDAADGLGGT